MLSNKRTATIGAFLLTGFFILLEHVNGGVVSHHLLAREDLPAISNWWGLVTVPALVWITFFFIDRREDSVSQSDQSPPKKNRPQIRFLSALLFGITVSVFWELGLESVLQYVILLPFLLAVFTPIHFPEYLLGFVIGMLYTFGGFLPVMIGLVLLSISFIIHKISNLLKAAVVSGRTS